MENEEARRVLGLEEVFTREELKAAYLKKTKAAHTRGQTEDKQQALNVARDTLTEELNSAGAIAPILTRELVRITTQQELTSTRRSAKDDLAASMEIAKVRKVNRLHTNRDVAGILAALAGGAGFLRENIAEILQVSISPWMSSALLLTSAYLAVMAFISSHAAKRVEERTIELNKVLTRQRTIDRILAHTFAESDSLSEGSFEAKVIEGIEIQTGVRQSQDKWDHERSPAIFRQIMPFGIRGVGNEVFEDYVEFLISSSYVTTYGTSGRNLTITKKK
ncbi:MAG: hypothetical protein ABL882_09310 [Sphingopyxis sp.]